MRVAVSTRAALAAAAATLSLALTAPLADAAPPAQAPTAAAPAATESATAGTVIDTQARPDGWRGAAHGLAIDYWTRGADGKPVPASGGLLLPAGKAPAGGWPVVAYTHGTSGYGPGCGGQSGPDAKADRFTSRLLASGYAVVAPDYVGLGRFRTGVHPYLNNDSEGAATIDLLHAARSVEPSLAKKWVVAGPSQGGQAALATAHMQSRYGAPTDFRGAIAVDPESDVEKVMAFLGPYVPPAPAVLEKAYGYLLAVLAGNRVADPAVDVNSYLSPYGRSLVDKVGTGCPAPTVPAGTAFGSLLAKPLGSPALRASLDRYMSVPTSGYTRPTLLLFNALDLTVPSPLHAKLEADFVANGVDHRTVLGTESHTEMNAAQWAAWDEFLRTALA
ncbi:lipase family protein [Gordonia sputi]